MKKNTEIKKPTTKRSWRFLALIFVIFGAMLLLSEKTIPDQNFYGIIALVLAGVAAFTGERQEKNKPLPGMERFDE